MLLVFAVAWLFSGCAETIQGPSLVNTSWLLSEWPGHTIPLHAQGTLQFEKKDGFNGKAFCNSFGGKPIINADSIQFGSMFSTKMYCQDLDKAERDYLDALSKATTFEIKDKKLYLYRNGAAILVFTSLKPAL